MPTVAELVAADPAVLLHRAREWESTAAGLAAVVADLDGPGTAAARDWRGADADAARSAHARSRDRLDTASAAAGGIARTLERYAGATLHAQQRLLEAVVALHPASTRIDLTTGRLSWVPSPAGMADGAFGLAGFVADVVGFRIRSCAALEDAARADADAAAALAALAPDHGPGPVPRPDPGAAPADVRRWWTGLTPAQRNLLLRTEPAAIGTLTGVPVADRDRANRARLEIERARLGAVLRAQRADPAGAAATGAALRGLSAVDRRLAEGGAFLLDVGAGRVVLSVGDPERAAHVVTHVPGTGAGWSSAGEDLRRAEATRDAAVAAGGGTVAAVLWTGYDAPPTLVDAAYGGAARDGAGALRAFQDGLRAGHEGPVHLTVAGHSYGTTVAGYAARGGRLDTDDLVLVGSPGVGVRTADELGLPPGRVWATVAGNDPIDEAPGPGLLATSRWSADPGLAHGADPTGDGFGARVFASAPGSSLPGRDDPATPTDESALAAAHSQYWDPGTPSLAAVGRIVAGTAGGQ